MDNVLFALTFYVLYVRNQWYRLNAIEVMNYHKFSSDQNFCQAIPDKNYFNVLNDIKLSLSSMKNLKFIRFLLEMFNTDLLF